MTPVTYKGRTDEQDPGRSLTVDGTRFPRDVPVEVEDEALVQELREGSDRLSEYEFEVEE